MNPPAPVPPSGTRSPKQGNPTPDPETVNRYLRLLGLPTDTIDHDATSETNQHNPAHR